MLTKIVLCLSLCLALATAGGCQALAAVLDKTSGDPKDPAKYVPEHDNMLIVVEDYQNPALVEIIADHMNHLIAAELIANKVAPIVNPQRLTLLKLDHPDEYSKMKLPAIGARLGARQLLYVNVTEFSTGAAEATNVMRGHAQARVRIVDCEKGDTRWPRDMASSGFPVDVDVPFAADSENTNSTAVREALGKALAEKVARLFYSATIDQPDLAPKYPESDLQ
jgi:hypothetical protein